MYIVNFIIMWYMFIFFIVFMEDWNVELGKYVMYLLRCLVGWEFWKEIKKINI